MKKHLFIPLLLCASSGLQAGYADEVAHKAIRAEYERASKAAALKYVDGIFSVRARNYQAFGVNGKVVDPKRERTSLERLVEPAISVTEKSEVVTFKDKDATHITCQVHDVMRIVMPAPQPRPPSELVIDTQCTDEWQKIGNTWKQTTNRVLHQTYDNHSLAPEKTKAAK